MVLAIALLIAIIHKHDLVASAFKALSIADDCCIYDGVEDHSSNVQTKSRLSTASCTNKVTSSSSISALQGGVHVILCKEHHVPEWFKAVKSARFFGHP